MIRVIPENLEPPLFQTPIQSITLEAGSPYIYTLPKIKDADGDKWKISVEMGNARRFVTLRRNTINIEPRLSNNGSY